jgi:hypothetical protein
MPSVGTFRAQPVTRAFVITQGPESNGVYYFSKSAIDTWYDNNFENVTKVSEGLYIVANAATFGSVVGNLNLTGTYDGRKTLIDFGKEVIIGNEINSRLLVLRRVQFWEDASKGGDGFEGYVVVENNTNELAPNDWGRFTVRVARV